MIKDPKLAELVSAIETLEERKNQETARHAHKMAQFDTDIARLETKMALITRRINPQQVERAKNTIEVRGQVYPGMRQRVVENAIRQLARGGGVLHHEYFGTKHYSGFVDQRCDCEYGYGPKHGTVVFSVGLSSQFRERTLLSEQIEDAVYYLKNLGKIQDTEERSA